MDDYILIKDFVWTNERAIDKAERLYTTHMEQVFLLETELKRPLVGTHYDDLRDEMTQKLRFHQTQAGFYSYILQVLRKYNKKE